MSQNYYQTPPPPASHKTRNILTVIGIAIVIILCCCVLAAALIYIDPFSWNLLGRLTGLGDTTAQVMTENTNLYMSVNLLNMTPDKIDRVVKPFAQELNDAKFKDTNSTVEQISKQLDDSFGITTSDFTPWIGQYIGIGISNIQLNSYGSINSANYVIAMEARDKNAADKFLQKLQDSISKKEDVSFTETTYKTIKIYNSESSQMAFCRSGNMVLVGMDLQSLEDSIDAQNGTSLAESASYKEMLKQLPGSRAVTLYASRKGMEEVLPALLQSMQGLSGAGSSISTGLTEGWVDSALSLSVVDAGVEVDMATTYDTRSMSSQQVALLNNYGSLPKTVNMLPDNTLVYIAGKGLNLTWESYRQTLIDAIGQKSFDDSMAQFENEYKFNPDLDLLPYLDGDWTLGVMPSNQGYLAQMAQVPMGAVGLFESKSPTKIKSVVTNFNDFIGGQGMTPNEVSKDLFEINDPSSESPFFAYGVQQSYLVIATSGSIAQDVFKGKSSLGNSSDYKNVMKALPSNISPILFVNLTDTLNTISKSLSGSSLTSFKESTRFLNPITFLSVGASPLQNERMRMVLIIYLKK